MIMAKYLLLTQTSSKDWAFNEWIRNGVSSFIIFGEVNKFLRMIRRIWIRCRFPFVSVWYSKLWEKKAKCADVIIVHTSCLTKDLPKYLNSLNPKAKIVAWYWNVVKEDSLPQDINGICEIWSFDPEDCKKYNMRFNHQYYFKSLVKEPHKTEWDVFFCGSDSGRGEKLTSLYNEFVKLGLNVNFKIVYPRYEGVPNSIKSQPLDYKTIADCNSKSKAILEIHRPGQSGATIRLMEALFNKKKIITNNPYVKNEPFYNENNIFLLGERSLASIKEFLDSDYDCSVDEFINLYNFDSWLKRFDA